MGAAELRGACFSGAAAAGATNPGGWTRVVFQQGVSPTVMQVGISPYGVLVFGVRPFLLYRSGFHFPQPCLSVKMKPPGYGPQGLVLGSIYPGEPFGVPIFLTTTAKWWHLLKRRGFFFLLSGFLWCPLLGVSLVPLV